MAQTTAAPPAVATVRPARLVFLLGPAFVASIAYVDPGNVAANLTAGARYGYLLVWVLVVANGMAMIIQYQSAKLGIVTGKSLPEVLGERLRPAESSHHHCKPRRSQREQYVCKFPSGEQANDNRGEDWDDHRV